MKPVETYLDYLVIKTYIMGVVSLGKNFTVYQDAVYIQLLAICSQLTCSLVVARVLPCRSAIVRITPIAFFFSCIVGSRYGTTCLVELEYRTDIVAKMVRLSGCYAINIFSLTVQ